MASGIPQGLAIHLPTLPLRRALWRCSRAGSTNRWPGGFAAVITAALALASMITPVSAATPKSVNLDVNTYFDETGPHGDFTATGDAARLGLICPSGRQYDTSDEFAGYQSQRVLQIQNHKVFVCDDGSGTILLKLQIHIVFATGETFTWVVEGGTGAYERLGGQGSAYTVNRTTPDGDEYHESFLSGLLLH